VTHTILGAAAALPIAVSRDPAIAAGCVWFGMVGGGLPDWLDLRSDFKSALRLKHRGASHSLFALVMFVGMFYAGLAMLQRAEFRVDDILIAPANATIWAWTVALLLGALSHLLSDACTIAGIRPFLPAWNTRVWLLPRLLRCRSDGYLDTVLRALAVIALTFGVVVAAVRWIPP